MCVLVLFAASDQGIDAEDNSSSPGDNDVSVNRLCNIIAALVKEWGFTRGLYCFSAMLHYYLPSRRAWQMELIDLNFSQGDLS